MPLHLNLNHELEKLKAERRRDPLKLSMFAIALVIAGFAAQYFWNFGKMASLNNQLKAKRASYAKLKPKSEEALKQEAQLQRTLQNAERLVRRIEGRFYWAPFAQSLIELIPAEVQLTRVSAEAQGENVKRVQINIDGLAAGAAPRKVAEELRLSFIDELGKKYKNVTATFRHLEDSNEVVKVQGQSLPLVSFAINIQLQYGEEAPPSVIRKPKPRPPGA